MRKMQEGHETGVVALLLGLFQLALAMGSIYYLLQYCGDGTGRCEAASTLPGMGQSLLAVIALGALGGCIHGLASLTAHKSRGDLQRAWRAFYLGRPFIGAGMAVMTYLVLVSGVMGFNVENELVILTWSALAGLYSEPALVKLKEVFATIFKSNDSNTTKTPRKGGSPV